MGTVTFSTASTASSGLTFFARKTMSPPPYTTIPLHPLHPLVWHFCPKDNVPTTIYHYSTVSTAHCIHWFDLFCNKDNVPTTVYHYSTAYCVLHPLRPLHPLVWPFCIKDNVPTTIYHYSTAYCVHCVLWFDLFVSKTMSPPPYTTILLHPLHTESTEYCIHCILHPLCPLCTVSTVWLHALNPLVWHFWIKDNVPTTIYHYSTASTAYCIYCVPASTVSTVYCVHCVTACTESTGLTFLNQRQCPPPPYKTILLCTGYCVLCPLHPLVWSFLYQRQCPHHHIPLFYCIQCILCLLHPLCIVSTVWLHPLHPLVWPFCPKDNVPTPIYHYSTAYCVLTVSSDLTFLYQRRCPTTIYHYSTASSAYCVYCIHCVLCPLCDCIHWIHWFDLFASKTMFPVPYTTILLCTVYCVLHTLSTASSDLTFLYQRQCPPTIYHYSTASTAYCIHCILHPLHTAFTASTVYCVQNKEILVQLDV